MDTCISSKNYFPYSFLTKLLSLTSFEKHGIIHYQYTCIFLNTVLLVRPYLSYLIDNVTFVYLVIQSFRKPSQSKHANIIIVSFSAH